MTHADDRLNGGTTFTESAIDHLNSATIDWAHHCHGTEPERDCAREALEHARMAFLHVAEFIGGAEFRDAAKAILPETQR